MKTILTTIFAIALMVFAFNTNTVMAGDPPGKFLPDCHRNPTQKGCEVAEIDSIDSNQVENEKDVADSGNEGTTSAAQESDQ